MPQSGNHPTRPFCKSPKSILGSLLNPITLLYDQSGSALLPDFSVMPEVFVSNADLAAAVSREVKESTVSMSSTHSADRTADKTILRQGVNRVSLLFCMVSAVGIEPTTY